MTASVAILIPAMRPHLIRSLCQNIAASTHHDHHIYVMSDRPAVGNEIVDLDVTFWLDEELRSWGRRLNDMYERTDEPFLFLGADDVCFADGWLQVALPEMERARGVVTVNDCMNPNGTLALVSREYIDELSGCIDQPGVIIHPGYRHNYSETELFQTAQFRGRWVYALGSVVEHRHFLVGKANVDDVYEMGIERYGDDKQVYLSRCHMWGVDAATVT